MILQELTKKKIITPPDFVPANTMFLCITGSNAYGMSTSKSDMDVIGFCIPPKHYVFPHLAGEIRGFGTQTPNFEQYIQHHIKYNEVEYDFTVFSIIKYFQMCFENNPNSLDLLYSDRDCILHTTILAEKIRDNRDLFLSKLIVPKLKGYAYSQFSKLGREKYDKTSKRYELTQKFRYDVKNAAHVYRLLLQCETLLREGV